MAYQSIQLTKERGVSHIMLNRPQVLNAISEEMRVELSEALGALESDPEARVLVISGSGKAFSAGADLRHFKFLYEEFIRSGLKTPFGGPELAQIFFRFPKPTIAAVNGAAVGWGMTVSLACDIRIASTQAKFSAPFVRVGLTPEFGSTCLLPRLIGYGRAAELLLTGRMIQAEEALGIGLVNRVVPHDELMTEAMSLAHRIVAQPSATVLKTKALLHGGTDARLEHWIDYEALVFQECMTSEEHYQAVTTLLAEMESRKGRKFR